MATISAVDVLTMVRKNLGDWSASFPDVALKGDVTVTEVRQVLGDTAATLNVPDTTMLIYVNDGQRAIVARHPWLLWTVAGATQSYADASGVTSSDTLFVPAKFKAALVHYVVSRCAGMAGNFVYDVGREQLHFKLYAEALAAIPYRWANIELLNALEAVKLDLWDTRPHIRRADDGTFTTYTAISVSDTVPTTALCVPPSALLALVAGTTAAALKDDHANPVAQALVVRYTNEYERQRREL